MQRAQRRRAPTRQRDAGKGACGHPGARLLRLCGAIALVCLSLAGSASAAAPPTGDPATSIATAPGGVVAGSVDAGIFAACGLRTNSTLVCWGPDFYGEASPPAGTFRAVSAGGDHSCGIRTNGTLTCWGDDSGGQSTPPAGTFTAVSAGWHHSCAIRTTGALACWGGGAAAARGAPSRR